MSLSGVGGSADEVFGSAVGAAGVAGVSLVVCGGAVVEGVVVDSEGVEGVVEGTVAGGPVMSSPTGIVRSGSGTGVNGLPLLGGVSGFAAVLLASFSVLIAALDAVEPTVAAGTVAGTCFNAGAATVGDAAESFVGDCAMAAAEGAAGTVPGVEPATAVVPT